MTPYSESEFQTQYKFAPKFFHGNFFRKFFVHNRYELIFAISTMYFSSFAMSIFKLWVDKRDFYRGGSIAAVLHVLLLAREWDFSDDNEMGISSVERETSHLSVISVKYESTTMGTRGINKKNFQYFNNVFLHLWFSIVFFYRFFIAVVSLWTRKYTFNRCYFDSVPCNVTL